MLVLLFPRCAVRKQWPSLALVGYIAVTPLGAMAAQCVIRDFMLNPRAGSTSPLVGQVAPAPMRAVRMEADRPQAGAVAAGSRGAAAKSLSEAQRATDEVRNAIARRDHAAFLKAMPPDAAQRHAVLRDSFALVRAFEAGSLPIVHSILKLDPDPDAAHRASVMTEALERTINGWRLQQRMARQGEVVVNPPASADRFALIALALEQGASPDGLGAANGPFRLLADVDEAADSLQVARILLGAGASIDKGPGGTGSPLADAAEQGRAGLVSLMLAQRKPTQVTLDEALVRATGPRKWKAALVLLQGGANPAVDASAFGNRQWYPLQKAAIEARDDDDARAVALALARARVDPNRFQKSMPSPLALAMHDELLMQALLEAGADANYRDDNGNAMLHLATHIPTGAGPASGWYAVRSADDPRFDAAKRRRSVELLLQYRADPTAINQAGLTPLMQTGRDDADLVALLLERGGTINLAERVLAPYRAYGMAVGPVTWALLEHNDALAAGLLARESRVREDDCGAIYYAAATGAARTLTKLLDLRVDPAAARGQDEMTAFIAAGYYGQAGSLALLLDRKAARVDESTAWHAATAGGHGFAMPTARGNYTALMGAAQNNHREAAELLLRRGARMDQADLSGTTALGYANRHGSQDVASLLSGYGARR